MAGKGMYLSGDRGESQAMTGVSAPAGKVKPDTHRSPWCPLVIRDEDAGAGWRHIRRYCALKERFIPARVHVWSAPVFG